MGMAATRTTTTTELVAHRARGYTWRDSGYVNSPEFLALRPSGAFLSTVLDLAKWDAALYEDRVLTKASRDAMWTRVGLTGGDIESGMASAGSSTRWTDTGACTMADRFPVSAPRWRDFPTTASRSSC